MTHRVVLEPLWILHARPWRDTSMLIEAFSRDHGRIGLLARGVRGPRGRWRGLLQPLQPLLMSWSGRGELGGVTACEAAGPPLMLRDEPLLSAWYMNELVMRLLPRHDPHPPLYAAYESALGELSSRTAPALRRFEKRLLDGLGWGASYEAPGDDPAGVVAGRRYGFSADRGVLAHAPGDIEVEGATLLALAAEDFSDPVVAGEARRVLRVALAAHLGSKPLQTRELLQEWRDRLKPPV